MTDRLVVTTCCIVGGGPAGMMLGFLLARAGLDTFVLEKHGDFLRDFRGDTIHPSTLQIMDDLGLLDAFLALPHQKAVRLSADVHGRSFRVADFSMMSGRYPFIAFMPQWDFLNFLEDRGRALPRLTVLKNATAHDLVVTAGRVTGVRASIPEGEIVVTADLVVGCDGRHSVVRDRAGLLRKTVGSPIDVLWFRVAKDEVDGKSAFFRIAPGGIVITIDRGSYYQCAYVIAKGAFDRIKSRGLPAFRADVVRIVPEFCQAIDGITDFDDVKLLTITVDRLVQWSRPGLLCIGDAAHAMSPVGGVGINLAIQDAVATANLLTDKLRTGTLNARHLKRVQARRALPAWLVQSAQVMVHNRLILRTLDSETASPPLLLRIVDRFLPLQGFVARMIGFGVRPERVVRAPSAARK